MRSRWVSVAVVMGFVVTLAFVSTTEAQKTKGKTRGSQTKYLMRGIMQPNCKSLAGLLKDSGPSDDKTWDTAACNASCLNEMSYLLMDDGRCPDGVWAGAAKELRENSATAFAAIEKKDLEGTNAAFKSVLGACAACHKAHRPK